MPELPEVKTIQDQLNTLMPFKIGSIERSPVAGSIVHTPLDALAGQQILRVDRKGKLLNFIVANGFIQHENGTATRGWVAPNFQPITAMQNRIIRKPRT